MIHGVWSLKFPIIFSFSLFCTWLNFLLPICLAEAWQALGVVPWCGVQVNQLYCCDSSKLGQSSGCATPWPAYEGGGIIPSNTFPEWRSPSNPMGWCLGYLYFYSDRSTKVLVCLLLLCPGLWKLSRDHDERNMVLLVCCIVRKWNNSKCMWFQIYSYHSIATLTFPAMGYLQVFRVYNPSDEVQLVKSLPAQDCWKVGRFLKRSLVVALCYSEARHWGDKWWHGCPTEVLPQDQGVFLLWISLSSVLFPASFLLHFLSWYQPPFVLCFCLFVKQLFTPCWR